MRFNFIKKKLSSTTEIKIKKIKLLNTLTALKQEDSDHKHQPELQTDFEFVRHFVGSEFIGPQVSLGSLAVRGWLHQGPSRAGQCNL